MTNRHRLSRTIRTLAANGLPPATVALAAIALWFLLSITIFRGKGYLLPGPQEVGAAFSENSIAILGATLTTLKEAAFGYLTAIILGVSFAAILNSPIASGRRPISL